MEGNPRFAMGWSESGVLKQLDLTRGSKAPQSKGLPSGRCLWITIDQSLFLWIYPQEIKAIARNRIEIILSLIRFTSVIGFVMEACVDISRFFVL